MRKFLVLSVALIISTSLASSALLVSGSEVTYGGQFEPDVSCTGSDCPDKVAFSACGDSIELNKQGSGQYYEHVGSLSTDKNVEVPEELSCGQGKHKVSIGYDGSEIAESELTVNAKDMNPHKGKWLRVAMNLDNPSLTHFLLTEDCDDISCQDVNEDYVAPAIFYEMDNDVLDGDDRDIIITQAAKAGPGGSKMTDFVSNELGDCWYDSPPTHDACDVAEHVFTKSTGDNLKSPDHSVKDSNQLPHYFNSWTPLHSDGSYIPDGELLVGYEPEYYDSSGNKHKASGGNYWFICRDGATMDNGFGKQVGQVVDSNKLYQCDTSAEEWKRVKKCGDNLDNDGDGFIDLDDPGCEGSADGNTEKSVSDTPANCPDQAVVTKTMEPSDGITYDAKGVAWEQGQGNLVSFINSDGELCEYGNFSAKTVLPSGSHDPDLFTCTSDGVDSDATGNGFSDAEFETNDNFLLNTKEFCQSINSDVMDSHKGQVPASVYFIPKETVPTTGENPDAAQNYIDMHVLSDGSAVYRLKTYKFQTLHDAEKKYGTYGVVENCLELSTDYGFSSASCWHNNESLAETAPLMKDLSDGYIIEGSSPNSDPLESFGIANAVAQNSLVSSDPLYEGSINDGGTDPVFDGGFAPKCEKEDKQRWVSRENKWQCSGAINNWEQVVVIPDISATDTTNYTIGMAIMPYNVKERSEALGDAILELSSGYDVDNIRTYQEAQADEVPEISTPSDAPFLKTVRAKCYPNGQPDYEGVDWKEAIITPNQGEPSPIAFWWESVDMSGISEFRCEWEYIRSDGVTVSEEGTSFDLVEDYAGQQDKRRALRDLFSGANSDFEGYNGIKETYEVNPKDGGGFNEEFKTQAKKWANTGFYDPQWQ